MKFEVYTMDGCPGCEATVRALGRADAFYKEIDLTDPKSERVIEETGFKIAPIVRVLDKNFNLIDEWSGYKPEKIKAHI